MADARPKTVSLFATCLVDQFFPEVGEGAVKVLHHLGLQVEFSGAQTCCGQPAFNSGCRAEAQAAAGHFLEVFRGSQWVVAPFGSCTAMVRVFYPELFRDDPTLHAQATDLASRAYELSEFLVRVLGVTKLDGRLQPPVWATYHDTCHALRELGISQEPRTLLGGIEGLELVEMAKPDVCCGFGGAISVKYPEVFFLKVGDKDTVRARFAEGRSREDKISAVQYVRFPVGKELREGFTDKKNEIKLVIEHSNYRAETKLAPETRQSLAEDLEP